ncbi:MAG: DUF2007 domain-containing protein [Halobacteriovoraceae bacterium]|nr:DUF2007 domain-containing protein [Halobacteriovoraceae bacterium]
MSDYVCVYKGFKLVEIELIKSKLTEKGIPYIFRSNDASGTMPHLKLERGCEILVQKEDKEEAATCLRDVDFDLYP